MSDATSRGTLGWEQLKRTKKQGSRRSDLDSEWQDNFIGYHPLGLILANNKQLELKLQTKTKKESLFLEITFGRKKVRSENALASVRRGFTLSSPPAGAGDIPNRGVDSHG
jgi:hypothetical protein